ncbi:MAG: general secretion pathway protein D [Pseudomonas sp.]|jgi:general secretion pathway protein D
MPTHPSRLRFALLTAGLLLMPLPLMAQITPAAASSSQQEERWTINLKDADIREFTDQVADITGETFILDPRVKGQVTVLSKTPLSLSEVYALFLSVMATHGFTVVSEGGQSSVIPNAEAKSNANNGQNSPDKLETRLIQVQQGSVAELIPLIRPLVPQYGHLAAVTSANALIISDRSANISRIETLIRQLDQKSSHDYSVVNLQHAWVMDAAELLNNAMLRGQAKGSGSTQVIADARTNRLILLGPPEARAKLVAMAQLMDTPTTRSANTRVIRLRHNDAKALAETLGKISEGLKTPGSETAGSKPQEIMIRADESLNALIIFAEPEIVNTLVDIVRQLDVPRAQVMVEAAIVEISGDISQAIGVQWAVDTRSGGSGAIGGSNFNNAGISIGTALAAIKNKVIPPNLPDGAIVGMGNSDFGVLVTALSANSNFNLLSTPSLLTLDNQKAEILVGQNVPFQTGSYTTDAAGAGNPFTTIERQDVGVKLKVTPHINDGATLRLEIDQEISSLAPVTTSASGASDLITNKRSIKSTVQADDGQIIVLGGLIQDDVTQSESKVPLLGDIPWVGGLFRSSKDVHTKRNLMVFLRPTIIRDSAGLAAIAGKKYSDIRILGNEGTDKIPNVLPRTPGQLFDGQGGAAVDLRQP